MGEPTLATGSQARRTELLHLQAVLSRKSAGHPRSQAVARTLLPSGLNYARKPPQGALPPPDPTQQQVEQPNALQAPWSRAAAFVLPPPPLLSPPFRRTPAVDRSVCAILPCPPRSPLPTIMASISELLAALPRHFSGVAPAAAAAAEAGSVAARLSDFVHAGGDLSTMDAALFER